MGGGGGIFVGCYWWLTPPPTLSQMSRRKGPSPLGHTTPREGAIWIGHPYHCQAKWEKLGLRVMISKTP